MKQILLVFLGGGLGSVARYLISKTLNPYINNFFLGTFTVNVVGCFLIGLILGVSLKESYISSNTTLLLATGFCGGFTTFSSFAFEKHTLLRSGDLTSFTMYLLLSITMGVLAVAAGLYLSK